MWLPGNDPLDILVRSLGLILCCLLLLACSAFLTLAHLLSPQSMLSLGWAGMHMLRECCKHSAAASQSATLQPHSPIGARTLSH